MRKKAILFTSIFIGATVLLQAATHRMGAGPVGFGSGNIRNADYLLSGAFAALKPDIQTFNISGKYGFIRGKKGTEIVLPENAFNTSDQSNISVELIEVLNPFDYLVAGIPMYTTQGEPLLSGGMVRLRFFNAGKEINLAPGKEVEVRFVDQFPGTSFRGYELEEGAGWRETQAEPDRESSWDNEEMEGPGFRVLKSYSSGWINLDIPEPQITCLKGSVEGADTEKSYNVISIGIDHRSYFSTYSKKDQPFRINTLKNKSVKLVVFQEPNLVGISETINTPAESGFMYDYEKGKDTCRGMVSVKLNTVDEKILKDNSRLEAYLGL